MTYLCSSKVIVGKTHAPVPAKLPGCGIRKGAVKVYQVQEVTLSTPAVMTCETALALHRWVEKGAKDAVKNYGGGVSKLKVAAGYACRTRNSRPGAKISEHGKGKAIDISAIYTKDGDEISVLKDWGRGKKGRMLKKMHKEACGPFGTVLGPNADRYHKDHFHFDTANHRGGAYCR
ncbi:MAG: extensin family protein [Shimia sp.]|nr:extensin family protein [Shimia sp.]